MSNGTDFDLGIGQADGPPETFLVLPGCRTNSMNFTNALVENHTKDDAGETTYLEGGGRRGRETPFEGTVKAGNTALQDLLDKWENATIFNAQVTIPALATLTGPAIIQDLTFTGNDEETVSFSGTLKFSGKPTKVNL